MTIARPHGAAVKHACPQMRVPRPTPRQLGITHPFWQPRHIHRPLAGDIRAQAARTQQDDWLPRYQRQSVVRHQQIPQRLYRDHQQWISRAHFLEHVIPWAIEHYRDILRSHNNLSPATFLRWAETETLYADRRTGRDVICRPGQHGIADLAEMSERTVQYCRAAAKQMGLYVDLVPGRMLSWAERCEARQSGSRQRGLSTVSLFCLPPAYLHHLKICTPPRGGWVASSSVVPHSCKPRSANGPTPHQPGRGQPRRRRRPPAGLNLAIALIQRLPWLTTRTTVTSPGRIAGLLTRYAKSPYPWTSQQLLEQMTVVNRRLRYSAPEVAHCPVALLAWYVHQIDPVGDHPQYVQDQERDAARRRRGEELTRQFHERIQNQIDREQTSRQGAAWRAQISEQIRPTRTTTPR